MGEGKRGGEQRKIHSSIKSILKKVPLECEIIMDKGALFLSLKQNWVRLGRINELKNNLNCNQK